MKNAMIVVQARFGKERNISKNKHRSRKEHNEVRMNQIEWSETWDEMKLTKSSSTT